MSLRAGLAKTAEEQALHRHLARAAKELAGAAGACQRFARAAETRYASGKPRNRVEGLFESRMGPERLRARQIERTIRQAMSLLNGIGHLSPRWDMADPDLISDAERAQIAQEEAEAKAKAPVAQGEGTTDAAE